MKPDFESMNTAELRNYLLSHRDNDEAFYKLVDRLEADTEEAVLYPCPDTPENIAIMEKAIREYVNKLDKNPKSEMSDAS